ncbi:hypothetical protein DFH06DRAFT_1193817 [Mycena polygramma]|nr:hypothetical protein DFH06DRAFT_1193817 [Mycena polygramma]
MGSKSVTSKRSKRSADYVPRYSSSSSRSTSPSQSSGYTSSYSRNSDWTPSSPVVVANMLAALGPAHQSRHPPPQRLRPAPSYDSAVRPYTPSSAHASYNPGPWGKPTTPQSPSSPRGHYVKASPTWNASFAHAHDVPHSPRGRLHPPRDTRPPPPIFAAHRSKSLVSYTEYEGQLPPLSPPVRTPRTPRSSPSYDREVHVSRPTLPSLVVQPSTPLRSGFNHDSRHLKSPASARSPSRSPSPLTAGWRTLSPYEDPNSERASLHRKDKSWWSGASRSPSPQLGVEVVVRTEVFGAEEQGDDTQRQENGVDWSQPPTRSSSRSPSPPTTNSRPPSPCEDQADNYTRTYRKEMGWSGEWTGARGMDDVVRSLRDLRVK